MSVGFLSSFQWVMGKPPFLNGTQISLISQISNFHTENTEITEIASQARMGEKVTQISQISQILPRRRGGLQMSRRNKGNKRNGGLLSFQRKKR